MPCIYGSGKSGWFYRQFTRKNKWIETQDFSKIDKYKKYYEFYHKQYPINEITNLLECNNFVILEAQYCNVNFKNVLLNKLYSFLAYYRFDKILNRITSNRFSSQITLLCVKKHQIDHLER